MLKTNGEYCDFFSYLYRSYASFTKIWWVNIRFLISKLKFNMPVLLAGLSLRWQKHLYFWDWTFKVQCSFYPIGWELWDVLSSYFVTELYLLCERLMWYIRFSILSMMNFHIPLLEKPQMYYIFMNNLVS